MASKINLREAWLEANKPLPAWRVYGSPENQLDPDKLELHRLTWGYLKDKMPFDPAPGTTWRNYAAEAANHYANQGLRTLQSLARKWDRQALVALSEIAAEATKTLSVLANRSPERLSPIARQRFLWPFLKAPKECFSDKHKELVKKIKLGQALPFSREALARVRPNNTVAKVAIAYLCRLEDYRKPAGPFGPHPKADWQYDAAKLGPFTGPNSLVWFEVAWKALLSDHGGKPELDPELGDLGKYRANHSALNEEQPAKTLRTRNCNIRDGIKEKFRKAIQRLAPTLNKKKKN